MNAVREYPQSDTQGMSDEEQAFRSTGVLSLEIAEKQPIISDMSDFDIDRS